MSTNRRAVGALVIALAACTGGDGATGPRNLTVDGGWNGSATNVSGSGVTCTLGGLALSLSQTDTTFAGNYTIATLSCTGPGGTAGGGPFAGIVVNGTIKNGHVTFDLDTSELHFTGSLNNNAMSGTTVWTLDLGPPTGVVVLTGSWSAAR